MIDNCRHFSGIINSRRTNTLSYEKMAVMTSSISDPLNGLVLHPLLEPLSSSRLAASLRILIGKSGVVIDIENAKLRLIGLTGPNISHFILVYLG